MDVAEAVLVNEVMLGKMKSGCLLSFGSIESEGGWVPQVRGGKRGVASQGILDSRAGSIRPLPPNHFNFS